MNWEDIEDIEDFEGDVDFGFEWFNMEIAKSVAASFAPGDLYDQGYGDWQGEGIIEFWELGIIFDSRFDGSGEIELSIIKTSDLVWCIRHSLFYHSESSGAIEAAMILGQIGDKKCSDSMMEILIQIYDEPDGRSKLVDALIRAIGQIGDESNYEVLSGLNLYRSNEDAKFEALAMLRPMYEAYIMRGAYDSHARTLS